MSGSFAGLGIAMSGLFANQRALSVTSHNVANANTEGYSRQRIDMTAYRADILPGGKGTLGTGVDVEAVKQIRDEFLDYQYRGEYSKFSEYDARYEVIRNIEGIMNEPTDSGLRQLMDDFFSSIQELNKNPESLSVRTLVRERAIALTGGIGNMSASMKDLQQDMNFEFQVGVNNLNNYADQVAKLNEIIFETELTGGTANDVRDQRNLLLDKMSELADIDYYEDNNQRFHVSIGGHEIVSHIRSDKLILTEREEKLNYDDVGGLVDIAWEDGTPFNAKSGKLVGILNVRDEIEGDDKGIPYYLDRLNEFMSTLTSEVNRIHRAGYTLTGETNIDFFTINGMSTDEFETHLLTNGLDEGPPVDITAMIMDGVDMDDMNHEDSTEKIRENTQLFFENNTQLQGKTVRLIDDRYYVVDKLRADQITISKDLEDVNNIAASETEEGLPGDGNNILNIANVRHDVALFDWGSPDDFVKSLVSNLGVDGQATRSLVTNTELLLKNVSTSRESVMGVSLDEEMANMVKYQHAYSASARMINAVDEMLDLVVNRLGLVGR